MSEGRKEFRKELEWLQGKGREVEMEWINMKERKLGILEKGARVRAGRGGRGMV